MAFPYNFSTVPADLKQLAQGLQANFRKAISGDSFTAAGDLLLGTGAGQYAKVAAGTNGSVLTADSTQPGLVAWRGASARYKVGLFVAPASTGNFAVTGVGFTPGLVEFTVGFVLSTDYMDVGNGVMDSTGSQWSMATIRRLALNTNGSSYSTSLCLMSAREGATDAGYVQASFVSMDSGGFTINFSATNVSFVIGWKAHA